MKQPVESDPAFQMGSSLREFGKIETPWLHDSNIKKGCTLSGEEEN
jgi:hypothetical protein